MLPSDWLLAELFYLFIYLLSFMMQEDLHQRSEGNLCPQPEIITYTLINYSVHYILQLLN